MFLYSSLPWDSLRQQVISSDGKQRADSTNSKEADNISCREEGHTGDKTSTMVVRKETQVKAEEVKMACVCVCACESIETACPGARENYKYKHAASTVGNLQPGWSRFHSSKCHLSNVLAYYDLSSLRSCWGIPCSLTAGPPTHNWLGSRSISASRP